MTIKSLFKKEYLPVKLCRYSFFMLFLVFSCQKPADSEKPKDLLGEQQMINVLVDLHMADAYLNYPRQDNAKPYEPEGFYKKVFEKNHTTKEGFKNSLKYYGKNPAKIDSLYDQTIEKLNILKATIGKIENKKDNKIQKK